MTHQALKYKRFKSVNMAILTLFLLGYV